MKFSSQAKQLSLDIFSSSLEKSLDPSNRWYRLANSMPWGKIERKYNKRLDNKHFGGGNKLARMVIGALVIKHKMNHSDKETIRIIAENPYMQFFVDMEVFMNKPIFDSSLFLYTRKRIDVYSFNGISLALMEEEGLEDEQDKDGYDGDADNGKGDGDAYVIVADGDGFIHGESNLDRGSLNVDASCCDVEVIYPTDLDVLNDARDVSERLIDTLCKLSGSPKSRTHRKQARRQFLLVAKKKRKPKNLIRKGIRQQLGYLVRNMQSIIGIISSNSTSLFDMLPKREKQWIGTAIKVYHQQKGMYESNTHQCPDRIISVFQPHVRPICAGNPRRKWNLAER